MLEQQELPEAFAGLGDALWWLGETEDAVRFQEYAYAAFRRRPDPFQAALATIPLYFLQPRAAGWGGWRGWSRTSSSRRWPGGCC